MHQKQKILPSKHILPLGALLCLLALGLLFTVPMAHAAPAADAAFDTYSKSVTGLSGEKAEDMHKAATAFIVYLKTVLPGEKKQLLAHLDKTLLVAGKNTKKQAVTQRLDAVFNDVVLQCVQKHDVKEPASPRNMVEYMVGDGCIWFSFIDDNLAKPYIFAVNNTTTK